MVGTHASHTLVIAGVHQAEREFGKDVLDRCRKNPEADHASVYFHLIENTTPLFQPDTTQAYLEMFDLVGKLSPRLVLDIHCGLTLGSPKVQLVGDPLLASSDAEYNRLLDDLKGLGFVNYVEAPRHSSFSGDSRFVFVYEGIEARLPVGESLESISEIIIRQSKLEGAEELSDNVQRLFLETIRRKNVSYELAVSETSRLVIRCHEYFLKNPHFLMARHILH